MKISFNNIPYYSKLFLDFLENSANLKEFLPSNFISDKKVLFNRRIQQTEQFKKQLLNTIKNSNNFSFNDIQETNYNLLTKDKTLVIVTGQQPSIYGGPLYNLYKAISAISYCQKYKNEYPEYDFVPLFWVEDSDDDIDEINHYHYIYKEYQIEDLQLQNLNKRLFSSINIDDSIAPIQSKIINDISHENSVINEIINNITNNYKLLADNFIASINTFTNEYGLLFVKSSEVYKNYIFNDIIKGDILNPNKIRDLVSKTNDKLSEYNYKIQADASDINFFYCKDGLRNKIEIIDNNYKIGEQIYTYEQIEELINIKDIVFSPKVLLRPILQDYFMPTAAYVGGAGEIAYLAQTAQIYNYYSLDIPIIEARHSFTLINQFIIRNLEKENIELIDLMKNYKELEKEIADELIDNKLEESFSNIESEINKLYHNVSDSIIDIDKSLSTNLDITINKSIELLINLKKKTQSQLKKKNETKFNRLMKSNKYVYPNNHLQERVLNIFNFINDNNYRELINKIYNATLNAPDNHYIIEI